MPGRGQGWRNEFARQARNRKLRRRGASVKCGVEDRRERDCREQGREWKGGQEELDEPTPGCDDHNEKTSGWIHMLGAGS